jgi:hypothetical protein
MNSSPNPFGSLRRFATPLVAALVVATGYWLAAEPALSQSERQAVGSRFRFAAFALPEWQDLPQKSVRAVHPSLERVSAMVSALGASVALHDLDGDGLANDLCHVDPRTDRVTLAPVPGTGQRFAPFHLDAGSLPLDVTMAPMGCLPGDMNEDGWPDVLVYYWGRTPIAFLRTPQSILAAGAFVAQELVPGRERWYSNSAAFADVDGDGHVDLVVGNTSQDGARLLDAKAGGIEVLPESRSRAFNGGWNRLLRWTAAAAGDRPAVTFREVKGWLAEDVARGCCTIARHPASPASRWPREARPSSPRPRSCWGETPSRAWASTLPI